MTQSASFVDSSFLEVSTTLENAHIVAYLIRVIDEHFMILKLNQIPLMVVGLTGPNGLPVLEVATVVHRKRPGLVPTHPRPTVENLAPEATRLLTHATHSPACVSILTLITLLN